MIRFLVVVFYLAGQFLAVPAYAGESLKSPLPVSNIGEDQSGQQMSDANQSPQRAKTGTGIAAGSAAGQTRRGGSGFLSTTLLLGIVVVGATAVIALEVASDNDTIPSTTSTN